MSFSLKKLIAASLEGYFCMKGNLFSSIVQAGLLPLIIKDIYY